jgi:ATP-dependent RNA helicase RhlE
MGFLPQIEAIMQHIPKDRHTMMFSATMPFNVRRMADRYLDKDPIQIDVAPPGTAASGIDHKLYLIDPSDKRDLLLKLLTEETGSTLIFTRMRQDVDRLARFLDTATSEKIARLHSDRTQKERIQALEDFRTGKFRILIATDIAARGLDIPAISHVIHYDIPENAEDYVHRSGRTARYNAKGVASSIATWMDKPNLEAIEAIIGQPLPRCAMTGITPWVEKQRAPLGRLRPKARRRPR